MEYFLMSECYQYIKTRTENIKLYCRGKFYQVHNFKSQLLLKIKNVPQDRDRYFWDSDRERSQSCEDARTLPFVSQSIVLHFMSISFLQPSSRILNHQQPWQRHFKGSSSPPSSITLFGFRSLDCGYTKWVVVTPNVS